MFNHLYRIDFGAEAVARLMSEDKMQINQRATQADGLGSDDDGSAPPPGPGVIVRVDKGGLAHQPVM